MQNDLLCFKLCYCYGVSEQVLQERFRSAMEIAERIQYFKNLKSTNELRILYKVIFGTIRSMNKVKDNWRVRSVLGPKETESIKNMGLDFDTICDNAESLDCALQIFITMANSKLPRVYQELEIDLPYAMFELLVSIRNFTIQELPAVQYMLKRQPATMNVYFSNSEILNVSVNDTLRSDVTVLKRLRVLCGDVAPSTVNDNSELGKLMKASKDRLFIRAPGLKNYSMIVVDLSTTDHDTLDEIRGVMPEQAVMEVHNLSLVPEDILEGEGTVVISAAREVLDDGRIVNLLMPLPVPRGIYRKILNGYYGNVGLYVKTTVK